MLGLVCLTAPTYALYSGGISDAQKREIVDGIRLPDWEGTS